MKTRGRDAVAAYLLFLPLRKPITKASTTPRISRNKAMRLMVAPD